MGSCESLDRSVTSACSGRRPVRRPVIGHKNPRREIAVRKVESGLFGSVFVFISRTILILLPKRLRASVTERRFRAPARTFREVLYDYQVD